MSDNRGSIGELEARAFAKVAAAEAAEDAADLERAAAEAAAARKREEEESAALAARLAAMNTSCDMFIGENDDFLASLKASSNRKADVRAGVEAFSLAETLAVAGADASSRAQDAARTAREEAARARTRDAMRAEEANAAARARALARIKAEAAKEAREHLRREAEAENARAMPEAEFMQRLRRALGTDDKMSKFKQASKMFKRGQCSAKQYFKLFGTMIDDPEEVVRLFSGLMRLCPTARREELKAQFEKFYVRLKERQARAEAEDDLSAVLSAPSARNPPKAPDLEPATSPDSKKPDWMLRGTGASQRYAGARRQASNATPVGAPTTGGGHSAQGPDRPAVEPPAAPTPPEATAAADAASVSRDASRRGGPCVKHAYRGGTLTLKVATAEGQSKDWDSYTICCEWRAGASPDGVPAPPPCRWETVHSLSDLERSAKMIRRGAQSADARSALPRFPARSLFGGVVTREDVVKWIYAIAAVPRMLMYGPVARMYGLNEHVLAEKSASASSSVGAPPVADEATATKGKDKEQEERAKAAAKQKEEANVAAREPIPDEAADDPLGYLFGR
jgi:hypothetical protein